MASSTGDVGAFVEWGGSTWRHLVSKGIDVYLGSDLSGLKVLEIGARSGRMSALFAQRGASVVAVDVDRDFVSRAKPVLEMYGVEDRVELVRDDGALGAVEARDFDVVFTKSVLVVIPELERYLDEIRSRLKPGGRIVFIENAQGGPLLHALRRIRHRTWDYRSARYFTSARLELVRSFFEIDLIESTRIPPVVLICGRKVG